MPRSTRRRTLVLVLAAAVLALVAWRGVVRPSNDRVWSSDQAVLPYATLDGHVARVHNIRDTRYRTTSDFDPRYYDRVFDLDSIETAWFVVEPFSGVKGPAHTFLSFGFANGSYVAISAEIRKERGESFSPLAGMLRRYELMYVVADERDVIGLRANYRHDDVYLYPVRATRAQVRAMFVDMLERANRLGERPEFYNTLTNTCTTNIVRHVNAIAPKKVPFSYKVLLPGYSDRLANDLGLLETSVPFEETRRRAKINDRARIYADSANFSAGIRTGADSR
ncbi:MAG: DUF4105 domain-containing protein [Gemmatimonadaceae bacterium]